MAIQGNPTIVSKQTPILKNMTNDPFLENACCSATVKAPMYWYFIHKDKEIEIYNNMVKQMGITLEDVSVITRIIVV